MRHVGHRSLVVILAILPAIAQTTAPRPVFEAAAIKPNPNCSGGRGGGETPTSGRVSVTCLTARDLIQIAYGMFADGVTQNPRRPQVFDGPGWIDSETFDIAAKAEDNARVARMYGPMMQSLLEERFSLKIHKETRQQPVYALTTAKNGSKLSATPEGTCATSPCGRGSVRTVNGNIVIENYGVTVSVLAERLVEMLNEPVIDRTGLKGLFDIHLEFASANASPDATGASIFTAVEEQLGLKLASEKGPVEVLVIDHIERPSPN